VIRKHVEANRGRGLERGATQVDKMLCCIAGVDEKMDIDEETSGSTELMFHYLDHWSLIRKYRYPQLHGSKFVLC